MDTKWYASSLLFFALSPLLYLCKDLWYKIRSTIVSGYITTIRIGSDRESFLVKAVLETFRVVTRSELSDLKVEQTEETQGKWSWQVMIHPVKDESSIEVTSKATSPNITKKVKAHCTIADPIVCGQPREISSS